MISALAIASIDPDQLELFPEAAPAFGEEDSEQLAGLAITGALSMVTFLVVNIACFKAVCDAWLGTQPDVGRSLRFGLRRAPAAFVLGLVWLIGVVLALFRPDHPRDLAQHRVVAGGPGAAVRAHRAVPVARRARSRW